jgi:SIR2-like domain/TIR domain
VRVFISYRRSDAPSASRQLAEALKLRFGAEEVFFDTRDMAAGSEWRRDAVRRVQEADVVLAIIGSHWVAVTAERAQRLKLDSSVEDVMRLEIETAFRQGRIVIPVLVDDAEMPHREALPRPFRPLADVQAQMLRHATWERDVEVLAEVLTHVAGRFRPARPRPERPVRHSSSGGRTDTERIASHLAAGRVVTVIGSGANAVDRDGPWQHGAGSLPNASELARHLARSFAVGSETDDLARISQLVSLTEGRVDLDEELRELLVQAECEPGSIHRFVARLPGRLRDLGHEHYQLVVTTNYDATLEHAFDAVHEPYDLVVFVATGEHSGRFVHVPWWDPEGQGPIAITMPNEYVELPIDDLGMLERTVIVKLHGGGVDLRPAGPNLRDNFVITEDDYIGYLTQSPISSLIPLQILNKLRESHVLFLGYRMRDWTLRVFLQRIWSGQRVRARSWAVEDPGVDAVDRQLWDQFGAHVVEQPALDFLNDVECELGRLAEARAGR